MIHVYDGTKWQPGSVGVAVALRTPVIGLGGRREADRNQTNFMQRVRPTGLTGEHGFVVLETNWSDLQPNGAYTALDTTELNYIKSINDSCESLGISIRHRFFTGRYAPNWAKTISGFSPLPWYSADGTADEIGPFWRSDYLDALEDCMTRLGDWYELNPCPAIREIVDGVMMTTYAEPYLRSWFTNPPTNDPNHPEIATGDVVYDPLGQPGANEAERKQNWYQQVTAAGYNTTDDLAGMDRFQDVFYEQFTKRSGFLIYTAFNPFQTLEPDGSGGFNTGSSVSITLGNIDKFRNVGDVRSSTIHPDHAYYSVVGNNSLGDNPNNPGNPYGSKGAGIAQIIERMESDGLMGFYSGTQTATLGTMASKGDASTPYGTCLMLEQANCISTEMPGSAASADDTWANDTTKYDPADPGNASPRDSYGMTIGESSNRTSAFKTNYSEAIAVR